MKDKVIMIVDDEPEIRNLLKELFELENFQVVQANSGNNALKLFRQSNIDCILSDIKMPDGNAHEMLRNLSDIEKTKVPIFLMTGHTDYSKKELLEDGVKEVFKKPFEIDTLISTIKTVLENETKLA